MNKTPNYTLDQTAELVETYRRADTDEMRAKVVNHFAAEWGKTPASVRAKLVSEGAYVAKTYKTKKGEKPVSKEQLVEIIARTMDTAADNLPGLEKATKATLLRIADWMGRRYQED